MGATTQAAERGLVKWNFRGTVLVVTHKELENFHDVTERLQPPLGFEIKHNCL